MRMIVRSIVGGTLLTGAVVLLPTGMGTPFGVVLLAVGIGILTGEI